MTSPNQPHPPGGPYPPGGAVPPGGAAPPGGAVPPGGAGPAPHAPAKLFRDEAKAGSVQCGACGGPITLRGFGAIERVMCPYCGTESKPEPGGALHMLQHAQRQRRPSVLPLHARGKLDGATWEILGIVWRECHVDGATYPWQEFLLFNPYKGYRWLVYSMTDSHWTLGGSLAGAPKASGGGFGHRTVAFKGESFKHFQSVVAHVSYVEGEFPWQVHVGDQAVAHEYVLPPRSISIEETEGDDGADVNFTDLHYVPAAEVWKSFAQKGSPPSPSGVSSTQPNPHRARSKALWLSFAALLVLWIVAAIGYAGGRGQSVVYKEKVAGLDPISEEITIGKGSGKTAIDFTMSAPGLSNGWAYAEVMLISQEREEAIGFSVEVDEWHGVSGGESWREGKTRRTVTVGGVEAGTYLLQIAPQAGAGAGKQPPANPTFSYRLRSDVVLWRYLLIPFFVILVFPIFNVVLRLAFEGRRWQQSDYASSEE